MTKKNKQSFDMTDMGDIQSKWKPSDGVNWDKIQRMRFKNVDCEIDPEDSYSENFKKRQNNEKT